MKKNNKIILLGIIIIGLGVGLYSYIMEYSRSNVNLGTFKKVILNEKYQNVQFSNLDVKGRIEGNMKTYSEMSDGTWQCDGHIYKYRLEISGRLSNAVKDSTYIYLSNIEDITFEQAWKASGLSSNMDDYFDIDEAVLVELPD